MFPNTFPIRFVLATLLFSGSGGILSRIFCGMLNAAQLVGRYSHVGELTIAGSEVNQRDGSHRFREGV